MTTTFTLPICSECAHRITLVKAAVPLISSVIIAVGVLLSTPDAPLDELIGSGVAGLIFSVGLVAYNMFDPASWFQGRFKFANGEYLRLFREANPGIAAEPKSRSESGVFITVTLICVIASVLLGATALDLLQQRLAPSHAFLLGQTPVGWSLLMVPSIALSTVPAVVLAVHVSDRIHRSLKLAPVEPMAAWIGAWAAQTRWKTAAAIAVTLLAAFAVVGFRSYFYVTDTGLSIRSPWEESVRDYRWNDVAAVLLTCRSSSDGVNFRYVLQMSDGQKVDFARVPARRLAPAFERISSGLETVPGIRYELDIADDALTAFGTTHGVVFADAIRSQASKHDGISR